MFVKENVCGKIIEFQDRVDYGGMLLASDFIVLLNASELAAVKKAIEKSLNENWLHDCVVVKCVRCHCEAFTDANSLFKLLKCADVNPVMIYCEGVLSYNAKDSVPIDGSWEVADGYCLA